MFARSPRASVSDVFPYEQNLTEFQCVATTAGLGPTMFKPLSLLPCALTVALTSKKRITVLSRTACPADFWIPACERLKLQTCAGVAHEVIPHKLSRRATARGEYILDQYYLRRDSAT